MDKHLPEAEKVKGFSKIPVQAQEIFKGFLTNFYKAWEYPEDHEIVEVSIAKEGRGKHAAQFIKATCENGEWYHVVSAHDWY